MIVLPVFLWVFPEIHLANKIKSYLGPTRISENEIYQYILGCINGNLTYIANELNLDVEVLNRIGSKVAKNLRNTSAFEGLLVELVGLLELNGIDEGERIKKEKERYILLFIVKNIIEQNEWWVD